MHCTLPLHRTVLSVNAFHEKGRFVSSGIFCFLWIFLHPTGRLRRTLLHLSYSRTISRLLDTTRSSNRTGGFPASGSRKRLTRSPTEGSRSGVVTGPSQTRSAETLPEIGLLKQSEERPARPVLSTLSTHSLWNCPLCGGIMHVVERLSAAQLLLRSPPHPGRCAA